MREEIKLCTELEWPDQGASLQAAIAENPANIMPTPFLSPSVDLALSQTNAPFIAVLYLKKWMPGRTLKISFLGNVDDRVQAKVRSFSSLWLSYINLKFNFASGTEGDIRISMDPGGSWSYIGTDATLQPKDKATMNFGWLTPTTPDDEYSRVVLHEFGHALGAIHEHQHPDAGIPWDRERVYEYYARQGWSKEMVDRNIFAKYNRDQLNMSSYDKDSIMHYAVPNELTVGDWKADWNRVLSEKDKQFMRGFYA